MTLEFIYVSPYLLPCGVSLIVSTVIHSLPCSQFELSETNKSTQLCFFTILIPSVTSLDLRAWMLGAQLPIQTQPPN